MITSGVACSMVHRRESEARDLALALLQQLGYITDWVADCFISYKVRLGKLLLIANML